MDKEEYFPPGLFEELASIEPTNWWFCSRVRLLLWVISNRIRTLPSFLEVGCGTAFILEKIREAYPSAELYGSEYFVEGLEIARKRVPTATLSQLDATVMTEDNQYDVIGAFDVLEHIDQDNTVLRNLCRALRSSGYLMITVPQHRWLWSVADDHAGHVRRYSRKELVGKVCASGLSVDYCTSFVSLLLPLMVVSRLRMHRTGYNPMSEFHVSKLVNSVLEAIMAFELRMLKMGVRFRMGGSLFLLAKKHDTV